MDHRGVQSVLGVGGAGTKKRCRGYSQSQNIESRRDHENFPAWTVLHISACKWVAYVHHLRQDECCNGFWHKMYLHGFMQDIVPGRLSAAAGGSKTGWCVRHVGKGQHRNAGFHDGSDATRCLPLQLSREAGFWVARPPTPNLALRQAAIKQALLMGTLHPASLKRHSPSSLQILLNSATSQAASLKTTIRLAM